MSQTAAIWSGLPPHAQSPESRNGYASPGMDHGRPASYMGSPFDFADILNPARDKRMSLDYSPSPSASSHSGPAPQHGKSSAHLSVFFIRSELTLMALMLGHAPGHLSGPGFDQQEGMDVAQEQNGFDYFPGANGAAFGTRYRTNASSSSSLGQGYSNMGSEQLYPHAPSPFADSLSSFSQPSHNSFDLVNGLSSSYSSGKVSPLTPNDPVIGLQSSPGFPNLGGGVSKEAQKWVPLLDVRTDVVAATLKNDAGIVGAATASVTGIQH